MLNTSDDDFLSPVVFKKFKSTGTVTNTRNERPKANKTRRKDTKKQLTLHQALRDNFRDSDTNPEHLQMALALSKSTSEISDNGGNEEEVTFNVDVGSEKQCIKSTLLEFGFKSNRCKIDVENRISKKKPTKIKKSKFRFITPILSLRTEEERQSLVESKISVILSENINTETDQESERILSSELLSSRLNEMKFTECPIFRLNSILSNLPENGFKVSELDIIENRNRGGHLLNDWKKIAMRDHTPERQSVISGISSVGILLLNTKEGNSCGNVKNSAGCSSAPEDMMLREEVLVGNCDSTLQTKISIATNEMNSALSPDLFDDTIVEEKNTNYSETNLATLKKLKKNLESIFSQDKPDLLEAETSDQIHESRSNRNLSRDLLECSIRNTPSRKGIYHFNGYNSDNDIQVFSSGSDDEIDLKETKSIGNYSKKNNSEIFVPENKDQEQQHYSLSSSDEEIETNMHAEKKWQMDEIDLKQTELKIRSKNDLTREDMTSKVSIISYQNGICSSANNCDTSIRSNIASMDSGISTQEKELVKCNSPDACIIIDSDEELSSSESIPTHNSNFLKSGNGAHEFASICTKTLDYTKNSSHHDDKEVVKEQVSDSTIKGDSIVDIMLSEDSLSEKLDSDNNTEKQNSFDQEKNCLSNMLQSNCIEIEEPSLDRVESNRVDSPIPPVNCESHDENCLNVSDICIEPPNESNDIQNVVQTDNVSRKEFPYDYDHLIPTRNAAQISPKFECTNLSQINSFQGSISLNLTKHIEEILACSYNQIDSLTLSDVECSSNLKNRDSIIKTVNSTSGRNITRELQDLITEESNESLENSSLDLDKNKFSQDSFEDVNCISDDELNYSCAPRNNVEGKLHTEPCQGIIELNESRVLRKYSSFTMSPTLQKTTLFSRNKSESFITPKRNIIIKTKNITPMMDYDALNTPGIVKELDKFGLKPLKRKRGVNLLKYIYETTHPTVSRNQINIDENEQVSKKMRSNECASISKPHSIQEILKHPCTESIPESEIIFENRRSTKIHICQIPLQIVWYNFLMENPQVYENILLYEPLQVEAIHKMLRREGFKFHLQDLITFFDRKCITIKVADKS